MTSPSPHPKNPPAVPSETERSSTSQPQRAQQQVWSTAASHAGRRVAAPTSVSSSIAGSARPPSSSQSPRVPWSPTSAFPSLDSASNRQPQRSSSISSSGSPPPSSLQQASISASLQQSGRLRTIAPSGNLHSASAAAASQGSGVSGSSSGGSQRNVRASPSVSHSGFGSPSVASGSGTSAAAQHSGQLTKIVIAQLFLLLSTIKDNKDKSKWDSQADQIRKLVDANGMEVFTKYFRRLLLSNAAQIWGPNRAAESSGNYPILVGEMEKITQDPAQASRVVEAIDSGQEEIFKDFDLSTLMEHFKLGPIAKITLASAFKRASKSDLRSKADAILAHNIPSFLHTIASSIYTEVDPSPDKTPPSVLAAVVDRLAQDPPRSWTTEHNHALITAFGQRYQPLVPIEIASALLLFELLAPPNSLVRALQKIGPQVTDTNETCKGSIETVNSHDINYRQVASTLLFMVIAKDDPPYNPSVFISALRETRGGQRLDWQDVVHAFDREGLKITKAQFKRLYDCLLPLAQEYENFDIQLLWGGRWHHQETQLAFAGAFASFANDEIDASQIPRLRKAYTVDDFKDATEEVQSYATAATRHPLISADATEALFSMVFRSSDTYMRAQQLGVVDNAINAKMDYFVCAVSAIPKPWGVLQDTAIKQLFTTILQKESTSRAFVLHLLWKRDRDWVASRLLWLYTSSPLVLLQILDVAREHDWLNDLIGLNNELSLDLAAIAHGRDLFDIETWLEQLGQAMRKDRLVPAISQFLRGKAEDETHVHRESDAQLTTVPLAVKTVYVLLSYLAGEGLPEDERIQLQRIALQAYPRLINYGEGFDRILDSNGKSGNSLPTEADAKMQEHYKDMYSGQSEVRDVVETLQRYKSSEDPFEQDLFACMIYGLFDEYSCLAEYPLEALATTAVLFGGIIKYDLLSKFALQVAISMVLEAVRDSQPEDLLFKFGLQALVNFKERLQEWEHFSDLLLEVPSLRGTEIWPIVEKVNRDRQYGPENGEQERNESNGAADEFLAQELKQPAFTCLSAEPPSRPGFYEEPGEQVQELVLFTLNNVSERNLEEKTHDLKTKLAEKHFQWLANYIVDRCARTQPNFHQLYLDLLDEFAVKSLWGEILRETFVASIKMLNSESTMNFSNERTHLKNLGVWLGLLTLARNQAIKFNNISFKDLLVEAYATQRLLVAIPFTCKVLGTAATSMIFKPPNSWTMEILQILLELYWHAELKLNLKFEIEVLFKTLGVDHKELAPSTTIRDRQALLQEEELAPSSMADGIEGFGDLSMISFNRARGIGDRFSPAAILPDISELSSLLKHNYTLPHGISPALQSRIRSVLTDAAERAVTEIIGPVVERSVTIAAISASQLVAKDFSLEKDPDKYRDSAHSTVRSLAGSLAGVTCKEPLRASMTNNISLLRQDLPEQALPQGSMLMFVNDNLETVCGVVEKAAEGASISAIDEQIEDALQSRKNLSYVEPPLSRWSFYIPDPYRPQPGGLNRDQLAIYEEFGRAVRRTVAHSATVSQDSGRQLPDVLQDQYSSLTGLPSIASDGAPQLSAPTLHAQQRPATPQHQLMNGYVDGQTIGDRVADLVNAMHQAAKDAANEDPSRHVADAPAVRDCWNRLRDQMIASGPMQKDQAAMAAAAEITKLIYVEDQRAAVVELLATFLRKLCSISEVTGQSVQTWCSSLDDDRIFNATVTAALVKSDLIDIHHIDLHLSRALRQRKALALTFFEEFTDNILLNNYGGALRADMTNSMGALAHWNAENSSLTEEIYRKLEGPADTSLNFFAHDGIREKRLQAEYIFEEWLQLQHQASTWDPITTSFLHQLHDRDVLGSRDDAVVFFRSCIDYAIAMYERTSRTDNDKVYLAIDGLAKLIVLSVIHRTPLNGSSKQDKIAFFESILTLVALSLTHCYIHKPERFSNKAFFRLFASLICYIHDAQARVDALPLELMQAVGRSLLLIEPAIIAGFSFSWMSLITHRLFFPALLNSRDDQCWSLYCDLICKQLFFMGELVKPQEIDLSSRDIYRGTLKTLMMLHHDFPEFLVENHFQLLQILPYHLTQMRNLITSAIPSAISELPDPFTEGLKVDRLEEIRRPPNVKSDYAKVLRASGIGGLVEDFLSSSEVHPIPVDNIVHRICTPPNIETTVNLQAIPVDTMLINALVLYIIEHAENADRPRTLTFSPGSAHAKLMDALIDNLPPAGRYHFIGGLANQLRFPNSHTHYCSYALFHLYRAGQADEAVPEIQQQITRVLLERIIIHRPHPWGLIVTLLEFLKNRSYRFWDSPYIKNTPDLERMFSLLLQHMR